MPVESKASKNPAYTMARLYANQPLNWFPLFIEHGAKTPTGTWGSGKVIVTRNGVSETLSDEDRKRYFMGQIKKATKSGVGISLADSGDLVDLDVDVPEARELVEEWFPKTSAVFGRKSAPGSHRLYYCSGIEKNLKWYDPLGKKKNQTHSALLEIRTNGQSVFPPSYHEESGEYREWACGNDNIEFLGIPIPERVTKDKLILAGRKVAIGTLLIRHWHEGSWHDAMLPLAGGLYRNGWSRDEVIQFIKVLGPKLGMEGVSDRIGAVNSTFDKIDEGEKLITSWKFLEELMDAKVVGKIRAWSNRTKFIDDEQKDLYDTIYDTHAYMPFGSNCKIIDTRKGPLKASMSLTGFTYLYKGQECFAEDGKPIELTKKWLEAEDKKIVVDERYLPGKPRLVPYPAEPFSYIHNLYIPPAIEPMDGDDEIEPFVEHMEFLFPDKNRRRIMYDVLAHIVQNPLRRLGWVPLLISRDHGVGKSWLESLLAPMIGPWNLGKMNVNDIMEGGGYNEFMYNTRLAFLHETHVPGTNYRKLSESLKELITGESVQVNIKYGFKGSVQVYTNFIFLSNRLDALTIEKNDRRYWVHEVTGKRSTPEYEALWTWTRENENGIRQVYGALLNRDLSKFDPAVCPPMTPEKQQMIDFNTSPESDFITGITRMDGLRVVTQKQIKALYFHKTGEQLRDMVLRKSMQETLFYFGKQIKWNGYPHSPWAVDQRDLDMDSEDIRIELDRTEEIVNKAEFDD